MPDGKAGKGEGLGGVKGGKGIVPKGIVPVAPPAGGGGVTPTPTTESYLWQILIDSGMAQEQAWEFIKEMMPYQQPTTKKLTPTVMIGDLDEMASEAYAVWRRLGDDPTIAYNKALKLMDLPEKVQDDMVSQLQQLVNQKFPAPIEVPVDIPSFIMKHQETVDMPMEKIAYLSQLKTNENGDVYDQKGQPIPLDFIIQQSRLYTNEQLRSMTSPEAKQSINPDTGEADTQYWYPLMGGMYTFQRQQEFFKQHPETYPNELQRMGNEPFLKSQSGKARETVYQPAWGPPSVGLEGMKQLGEQQEAQRRKEEESALVRQQDEAFKKLSQRASRVAVL